MADLVRCKACGLVLDESKVGDVCPACGLPKKVFEPYKERVSAKRKRILDLYLHPISVHLPQAFTITIPPLILLSLIGNLPFAADLLATVFVLAVLLPITVLAAIALGILDGKTRFKRLATPYIKTKIGLGILLFILATATALVAVFIAAPAWKWAVFFLALGCLIVEVFLGKIGGKMLLARING